MTDGKLFFALMYKDNDILNEVVQSLKNDFGDIVRQSKEYWFDFTDYYKEEFGSSLKKTIIIFDNKIEKKDLVEIKIICSQIEDDYSEDKKRKINIDPGYINEKGVVLASFKSKDFKEDLDDGVFAHKVLEFENGSIKDFQHTFDDFKSTMIKDFFLNTIK